MSRAGSYAIKSRLVNRDVRRNLLTYLAFLLFAEAGIICGNRITGNCENLRVWE